MSNVNISPLGLRKQFDVAFVGFLDRGDPARNIYSRVEYLDHVFRAFPNSWFSYNTFFTDAAVRYARARVGFNISKILDLNMRFFEVLSYGTCLVTNKDVVGWDRLNFVDGEHFIGYLGKEDAVKRIAWVLDNPDERERIALAGHELVRAQHTYVHRVDEMLNVLDMCCHIKQEA